MQDPKDKKAIKVKPSGMKLGSMKKKSFPDLNKDGKITKADILKGRGVIKQFSWLLCFSFRSLP